MEFLLGRTLHNNIMNLAADPLVQRALRREGWDLDRDPRAGAGRRAGQRRSRPAGGLLHRFAGHAAVPGDRLRPALRVRHLPAVDSRRLPGRSSRTTGCGSPIPGRSSARARSSGAAARQLRAAGLGDHGSSRTGRRRCSASPTIGRWSATARDASTRCGCGRPRRRRRSTLPSSRTAISSARSSGTSPPSR